mgnify:CR=1 FL=1
MNENEFATGSVPVMVAARIYGKDASWVRAGIISGWLPIGKATRNGQLVTKIEDMNSKYGRINFYISPKRLYEETVERGEALMGTTIRPELSEKNPYWIEKHRYYELKHFCLQYPIWRKAYSLLDGYANPPKDLASFVVTSTLGDPTAKCAMAKTYYSERTDMVERVAEQTDRELAEYILKAVTEGWSYDILKARLEIPCCKDVYYELYRRFFWLLNKERK